MEALVELAVSLIKQIVELFSAGDKEKEREALLKIASRTVDEVFKRSLSK